MKTFNCPGTPSLVTLTPYAHETEEDFRQRVQRAVKILTPFLPSPLTYELFRCQGQLVCQIVPVHLSTA